jgi:transcriptional regulator with XRE-family HTH domain
MVRQTQNGEMSKRLKVFIREWRQRRALSQRAFSDKIAEMDVGKTLSHSQICRIEKGQSDITGTNLVMFARVLKVDDPRELLFPPPDEQGADRETLQQLVRMLRTGQQQRQAARLLRTVIED